jgi:hypothetical protein
LRHGLPKFRLTHSDISAGLSFPSMRLDRLEQSLGGQPQRLSYPSSPTALNNNTDIRIKLPRLCDRAIHDRYPRYKRELWAINAIYGAAVARSPIVERRCATHTPGSAEWTHRVACHGRRGRLDGRKYFVHAIEIDLPLGGQCQPPGRAIDETHTEALLQSRDELCHGGWRQTYVFGLPRSATRWKMAISVDELAIPEIPS